ncbi:MAG: methyl-accepting chemotaxis protein [bacterium]
MNTNGAGDSARDLVHHLYASFRDNQQRLSSQLWDLFSIAALNASFAEELLTANRANKESIDRIYEDLDEVTRESMDVSERTERSLAPLQEARDSFSETRNTVDRFAETLEHLRRQFQGIRDTFATFQDTMGKISKTLAEIDDVSDLTHLLSLNASIEAARAGKHGVGFKVVAEEIKKLSDKSAGLTEETNNLLTEVQTTVSQALSNLSSYDEVREGVDSDLASARSHLQEQSRIVDHLDENVREIARSAQRQSQRTGRIHDSMDRLQHSAAVTTDAARHVDTSLRFQSSTIAELRRLDGEQCRILREHTDRLVNSGIIARGDAALLVGHDVAYPPWVGVGEGRSKGISIDVFDAVARELAIHLAYEAGEFEEVLSSFFAGTINTIVNVGWPNVAFDGKPVIATNPYAWFEPVIFTRSGAVAEVSEESGSMPTADGLVDPERFRGKRVAAQRGSYVEEYVEKIGAEVVPVSNDVHGMAKVVWREADGLSTERQVGRYLSRRYFGGEIVEATSPLARIHVVMVLHDTDTELRDRINAALESPAVRGVRERLLSTTRSS